MSKVVNYGKEALRWWGEGKPYRTESEISGIFNDHCRPCEHFDRRSDARGVCRKCGCPLRLAGNNLNKIAWATTSCPVGKW